MSRLVKIGNWEYVCSKVHEYAKEVLNKYGVKATLRSLFYWASSVAGLIVHSQTAYRSLAKHYARYREKISEIDVFEEYSKDYYEIYYGIQTREIINIRSFVQVFIERIIEEIEKNVWRIPKWCCQSTFIDIWCEKTTILSAIRDFVINDLEVGIFLTRGFSSIAKIYSRLDHIAEQIKNDKFINNIVILTITDFDPSGLDVEHNYEEKIKNYGFDNAKIERIMITQEQIIKYNLPARPSDDPTCKRMINDPRYRKFLKYCEEQGIEPKLVEVDSFLGVNPKEFVINN